MSPEHRFRLRRCWEVCASRCVCFALLPLIEGVQTRTRVRFCAGGRIVAMTLAQGRAPKEPAEGKASRLDDAVGPQTEAVVDLDAIAHNVRVLREFAGDAALLAVIKAERSNHGDVRSEEPRVVKGV